MGIIFSSFNGLEPLLRFRGFKGNLPQIKLSKLFHKCIQKNKDGSITNVICNSAKNGLIPQRDFFDKDIANSENTTGYYIIKNHDFVYNPRKSNEAPYGPVSTYKYAEDGIVSPLYLCFRAIAPLCTDYFEMYFKSSAWHRYIYLMGDSGARHDRVSIKDEVFFDMPVRTPSLPEQQKIAAFLSLVDARIEKQRQLVESLKKYKRGVFQNIYCSKSLNWEKRTIKNFSPVYGGYAFDSKRYDEKGFYKIITIGNVTGNRYISTDCNHIKDVPLDLQEHQYLKKDDIVISMTGNVGRVSLVNIDNCLLNQRVAKIVIKNIYLKEYIYQVLASSDFEQEMNNKGQGAAQKNIKNSDIESFIFYIPEDQNKIKETSKVLYYLDSLIEKNDSILNTLISTKKGLLQQMFI